MQGRAASDRPSTETDMRRNEHRAEREYGKRQAHPGQREASACCHSLIMLALVLDIGTCVLSDPPSATVGTVPEKKPDRQADRQRDDEPDDALAPHESSQQR